MLRALKLCGMIVAILLFIWIADYGFILVSERSTIAVVIGVLIFLGLFAIAIVSIDYFVKKFIKKRLLFCKGIFKELDTQQTGNVVAGDQAGRDINKKSKKGGTKKCCG
jgi:hypothetical protein